MPHYQITHKTAYHYEEAVSLCYNEGRVLPRTCSTALYTQECLGSGVHVEPAWNDQRERLDFFGNRVVYFALREPHAQMVLTATSDVTVAPVFDPLPESMSATLALLTTGGEPLAWEKAVALLHEATDTATIDARQFALPSPFTGKFSALEIFAGKSFVPDRPLLEATADLMVRIHDEFDFVSGATTIATPLAEVLETRSGVCQDFAHLMLACLRCQGLAARYVSGYIETLPPPGQEKLEGSDASHAWCSLYVPGLGWVDFDPTNNLLPQDQHVVLGWGRDFGDVTPLKGVFFGDGRHTLEVAVDMRRAP